MSSGGRRAESKSLPSAVLFRLPTSLSLLRNESGRASQLTWERQQDLQSGMPPCLTSRLNDGGGAVGCQPQSRPQHAWSSVESWAPSSPDTPILARCAHRAWWRPRPLDAVPGGPDPQTTGVAKIEQVDGRYMLQVDATGLRSPSGFYEVWLMNAQNSGLVAVGTFNADQTRATFPIPAGLPLTEFNSVDISDEPFDGVPGHSTVSVLRGTFTA